MESTASLISPSSPVSASTFSFSPLHSPRQQHFNMSPSPTTVSNSTSPIPSPRRAPSFADNLDLSSSSSSMWNTPRPCVPLQPPPEFAFSKSSARPPTETSAYTSTTTTENTRTRHASSSETRKPRRPAPDNHYSTLGVPRHATSKEIRAAYRKLALQYHPDVSPLHQLDTSTKVFAEINEAYSTLSDPQKRQLYDLKLALESPIIEPPPAMAYSYPMSSSSSSPLSYSSPTSSPTSNSSSAASSPMWASSPASSPTAAASSSSATMWTQYGPAVRSPREYTHAATGRVYPSMNSFYREWRRGAHAS